jgi:3-oxoacyl-[acyl-carrier-protein] synthase II
VPGAAAASAQAQWDALRPELRDAPLAVMSGATGVGPLTREEHAFLTGIADSGVDLAVRGTAAALGHTLEASFIANMVLGVSCLDHGEIFPPLAPDDALESRLASTPVEQVLITGWGNLRGEGMALMESVNG